MQAIYMSSIFPKYLVVYFLCSKPVLITVWEKLFVKYNAFNIHICSTLNTFF